jgi:serine/threonine kinase PknH
MARGPGAPARQRSTTIAEPGARIDGYRIERIVSKRRGVNTIAEAAAPHGERVTVDVLAEPLRQDRELRRRMGRLVPLRASVDHPNVLKLLRSVDGGQRLFMQSVPPGARTLADLLAEGPLDHAEALKILGQVAGALETARLKGLVHRALAPRSIVVEPGAEPTVFLTDFGIGAPRGRACELPSVLEEASYRAPEEIRGDAPEPASNVYSLTCMLVECLTGSPPYSHSRPLVTLHAHLTAPPPRISERDWSLPERLDDIVASGLAKDPREREGSAAALVKAAAIALDVQISIPVVRDPRKQPPRKPARKWAPGPGPAPAAKPAPQAAPAERPADGRPPAPARPRGEQAAPAHQKKPLFKRAPTWIALALAASAAAGFATGTAGSSDEGSSAEPRTALLRPAPAQPAEPPPPVVSETIDRLDARRVAIRKRLNAAELARGQAATAASLSAAFGAAERRIAAAASTDEEEELAARLGDAEAAYRSLAAAARDTNRLRWRAASAEALESERELAQLLRNNAWF